MTKYICSDQNTCQWQGDGSEVKWARLTYKGVYELESKCPVCGKPAYLAEVCPICGKELQYGDASWGGFCKECIDDGVKQVGEFYEQMTTRPGYLVNELDDETKYDYFTAIVENI